MLQRRVENVEEKRPVDVEMFAATGDRHQREAKRKGRQRQASTFLPRSQKEIRGGGSRIVTLIIRSYDCGVLNGLRPIRGNNIMRNGFMIATQWPLAF